MLNKKTSLKINLLLVLVWVIGNIAIFSLSGCDAWKKIPQKTENAQIKINKLERHRNAIAAFHPELVKEETEVIYDTIRIPFFDDKIQYKYDSVNEKFRVSLDNYYKVKRELDTYLLDNAFDSQDQFKDSIELVNYYKEKIKQAEKLILNSAIKDTTITKLNTHTFKTDTVEVKVDVLMTIEFLDGVITSSVVFEGFDIPFIKISNTTNVDASYDPIFIRYKKYIIWGLIAGIALVILFFALKYFKPF